MDEAKAVLERLARIDRLRAEGSDARTLLPELHALLAEGRAWLAREQGGLERATSALEVLEGKLAGGPYDVAAVGSGEEVGAGDTRGT